jgi:lysine biosynthesis protein LysW
MYQPKVSNMSLCPECDCLIQLNGKLRIGQRLSCRRCDTPLVIVAVKPLGLAVANSMNTDKSDSKIKKKKNNGKGSPTSADPQIPELKTNSPPPPPPLTYASMTECPECEAPIRFLNPPKLGQPLVCTNCEEILEVISIRPLVIRAVEDEFWD